MQKSMLPVWAVNSTAAAALLLTLCGRVDAQSTPAKKRSPNLAQQALERSANSGSPTGEHARKARAKAAQKAREKAAREREQKGEGNVAGNGSAPKTHSSETRKQ